MNIDLRNCRRGGGGGGGASEVLPTKRGGRISFSQHAEGGVGAQKVWR